MNFNYNLPPGVTLNDIDPPDQPNEDEQSENDDRSSDIENEDSGKGLD